MPERIPEPVEVLGVFAAALLMWVVVFYWLPWMLSIYKTLNQNNKESKNMTNTETRFAYIRDYNNYDRVLTLAFKRVTETQLAFGWSVNRPTEIKFDYKNKDFMAGHRAAGDSFVRTRGRQIAIGRMNISAAITIPKSTHGYREELREVLRALRESEHQVVSNIAYDELAYLESVIAEEKFDNTSVTAEATH